MNEFLSEHEVAEMIAAAGVNRNIGLGMRWSSDLTNMPRHYYNLPNGAVLAVMNG